MQTFLPYPSFLLSAQCLDRQRLGKQRVEAKQILQVLIGKSSGWANHPATKMWAGYEGALAEYGLIICETWIRRGYRDNLQGYFSEVYDLADDITMPPWLYDKAFHDSHKSNLLRKDFQHYSQFGWSVPDNLEYVWPI